MPCLGRGGSGRLMCEVAGPVAGARLPQTGLRRGEPLVGAWGLLNSPAERMLTLRGPGLESRREGATGSLAGPVAPWR